MDEWILDVIKVVGGVALGGLLAFAFWYDTRNNARKARELSAGPQERRQHLTSAVANRVDWSDQPGFTTCSK